MLPKSAPWLANLKWLLFGVAVLVTLCVLVVRRGGGEALGAGAFGQPRTLLVIHGLYRTLDYTVDSIVWNLVEANEPCDVVLATPTQLQLTYDTELKLQPHLIKTIYTHGSRLRNYQPVLAPLLSMSRISEDVLSMVDTSSYEFVALVRSDVYVAKPLNFTRAYGYDSKAWNAFRKANTASPLSEQKRDWFFSAGMEHYRGRTTEATRMWQSTDTPITFNADLVKSLQDDSLSIAETARRHRLTYVVGTDWIYFGRTADVLDQMRDTTANAVAAGVASDVYFRESHKERGRSLVNLINPLDYAVSMISDLWFGGYSVLTRSPPLVAFVLRREEVFYVQGVRGISSVSDVALVESSTVYAQIRDAFARFFPEP